MEDIDKIILAAENGGKVIRKYFGRTLELQEKSIAADVRTKADLESEHTIIRSLKASFPDYNILSEESGFYEKDSEYTFVIDPLDGSNNFVLGIPNFAVSIGLMKKNNIIAGVIHQPILGETYYAEKGKGSFLNDQELRVNQESDITKATVSYTCGYINSDKYEENLLHKLNQKKIKRMLQNWCPSHEYCLLASGKLEAIINNRNELYDYCAGKIIAKEAGAKITTFSGKSESNEKSSVFLATNGTRIHDDLLEIV